MFGIEEMILLYANYNFFLNFVEKQDVNKEVGRYFSIQDTRNKKIGIKMETMLKNNSQVGL